MSLIQIYVRFQKANAIVVIGDDDNNNEMICSLISNCIGSIDDVFNAFQGSWWMGKVDRRSK